MTLSRTREGTIAKVHEQAIYLGGEDGPARCERLGIPPGGGIFTRNVSIYTHTLSDSPLWELGVLSDFSG